MSDKSIPDTPENREALLAETIEGLSRRIQEAGWNDLVLTVSFQTSEGGGTLVYFAKALEIPPADRRRVTEGIGKLISNCLDSAPGAVQVPGGKALLS